MGHTLKQSKTMKRILGRTHGAASLDKRLYTLPDLLRLTGLTRRQATYWAQTGLLTPTMRNAKAEKGKPVYFYSSRDVVKALIVCELRRAGFSPRQLQQVARNLKDSGIRLDDTELFLLTDGYSVYYATSNNEVVDVLKHHRQMLFMVTIHDQVEKLRRAA
jgi:DNA-binding transcriptional MerR regulator